MEDLSLVGMLIAAVVYLAALSAYVIVVAPAVLVGYALLVAAMLGSMTLAALGTPETRWGEYTIFAAIMLVIGVAMFIWGLGMPIPILPKELTWR